IYSHQGQCSDRNINLAGDASDPLRRDISPQNQCRYMEVPYRYETVTSYSNIMVGDDHEQRNLPVITLLRALKETPEVVISRSDRSTVGAFVLIIKVNQGNGKFERCMIG